MRLLQLQTNACGGISPAAPVIVDFTRSKYVLSSGDMGVGKTSLLSSLLMALGQLSKETKDLINLDSDKIDINLDFIGNDKKAYNVRVTKSMFKLTYDGENISSPIAKVKELLGVPGISPMAIKNGKLQDIIKWLASYSKKTPEEFEQQAKKLKDGIKTSADNRADANRSRKALDEYLSNEVMYEKWEESEKKYTVKPDIEALSKKLEESEKARVMVMTATQQVQIKQERKESLQKQIEQLQKDIEIADKQILINQKIIDDNPTAQADYEDINTQYKSAATDLSDFNKWQEIKEKKSQRDQFETLSQQFDATEKELIKERKELQAEILPDIKGVELVMEDTHEDGKIVKEGLYWEGRNVAQLSESEWWSLVMQIWRKYKVKIVVIDNFQSLGTKAVELIERLIKDGAYVLAAEMKRGTQTLEIEYKK